MRDLGLLVIAYSSKIKGGCMEDQDLVKMGSGEAGES
jgi:hypothetical protein